MFHSVFLVYFNFTSDLSLLLYFITFSCLIAAIVSFVLGFTNKLYLLPSHSSVVNFVFKVPVPFVSNKLLQLLLKLVHHFIFCLLWTKCSLYELMIYSVSQVVGDTGVDIGPPLSFPWIHFCLVFRCLC